jgi:hypothetical protein
MPSLFKIKVAVRIDTDQEISSAFPGVQTVRNYSPIYKGGFIVFSSATHNLPPIIRRKKCLSLVILSASSNRTVY